MFSKILKIKLKDFDKNMIELDAFNIKQLLKIIKQKAQLYKMTFLIDTSKEFETCIDQSKF